MAGSTITGIAELAQAFKQIESTLGKKVGLKMVAAAGGVIKKQAKANAQALGLRRTGALIRNIAIKREKKAPSNTIQYNVGVRHGRALGRKAVKYLALGKSGRVVTKYKNDPFYWRFLEFGTKHISAKKPITNAFDKKQNEALAAMSDVLDKEIIKANNR